MNTNVRQFFAREKHVALNAQPPMFRLVKWIMILIVAALVYMWKGPLVVGILFAALFALGTSLHFLLRWKTKGWTQDWGPYKKIPLN